MKRTTALIATIVFVAALGGCGGSQIAGEAFDRFRGGKGSFTVVKEVPGGEEARPLGVYKRFQIEPLADGTNGQVPAELFAAVPVEFEKELAKKKIANAASGKTLLIRGKVLHYETAGGLKRLEEILAQIQFIDADTGKAIAEANCVGRSKAFSTRGIATKAQGLARAIVSYIDQRYPQDLRVGD